MNRIIYTLLSILLSSILSFGQLSKGQGEMIKLTALNCNIYLPQHFKIMDNGSGVMHNATGTIVTIVKVPSTKTSAIAERSTASMRDMLVDSRMTNVEFEKVERSFSSTQKKNKANNERQIYEMKYHLQEFDFERINIIIPRGKEQYLVVANYTVKYKDKVKVEIDRIINSIQFQ